MTDWRETLARSIEKEGEAITLDFETRGGSNMVHVLAVASMGMHAHEALTNCGLDKDTDQFCRTFVDEAYAAVLRERGWRVERPEVRK